MKQVKKGVYCKTVGELKKAIARLPDSTRLETMDDERAYLVEMWKLESDELSYEEEKNIAEYEGRRPDFIRVMISEEEAPE